MVLKFIQDAVLHFTSHRSRRFLCSTQGRASSRPERRSSLDHLCGRRLLLVSGPRQVGGQLHLQSRLADGSSCMGPGFAGSQGQQQGLWGPVSHTGSAALVTVGAAPVPPVPVASGEGSGHAHCRHPC